MSQQRNNNTVVKPYKDRYGRYQFKIILFIVLVFIACITLLIGKIEGKDIFLKKVTIFFSQWWWIFVAIGLVFFYFLFRKRGSTKKIDINKILAVLLAALVFYVAYVYFPKLRFWESKATTVSFSPNYEALNTDGGENVFKNKNHRLRYTIHYTGQVNFRGYNFIPKKGEKITVLREKIGTRRRWIVEYAWVNGEVVARDKTPQPYDEALAGDWLVSIESTNTWPATLYVEKVY